MEKKLLEKKFITLYGEATTFSFINLRTLMKGWENGIKQEAENVQVYTAGKDLRLVGSLLSKPLFVASDGEIDFDESFGLFVPKSDARYVAWLGTLPVFGDNTKYFLRTKNKASEIREVLLGFELKRLNFNYTAFR